MARDLVRPLPVEPAGYDPENKYQDPVLYYKHREAAAAERTVAVSEAKYIRNKLRECYHKENVNQLSECRDLAKAYLQSISGAGVYKANSGPKDEARW